MSDPYAVLGVARGASADEVKAAYRAAVLLAHPDKCSDAEVGAVPRRAGVEREAVVVCQAAASKFAALTEAWNALRDPAERRKTDERLGVVSGAGLSCCSVPSCRVTGFLVPPQPLPPSAHMTQ